MQRYDIYFSWRHLSAIKVENAIENVRFLSFSPLNIALLRIIESHLRKNERLEIGKTLPLSAKIITIKNLNSYDIINDSRTARCAIAFFLVSVLINSQGAVVVAMLPLASSLGIDAWSQSTMQRFYNQ